MVKNGNVFCDKCGKRLGPGETTCSDCGTPVSFVNVSTPSKTNFCNTLSIAVLILGIIGSIYLAYKFGVKIDTDYDVWTDKFKTKTVRDFATTLSIFVSGTFGTFILYTILSTLGSISDKLDDLSMK